MTALPTGAYCSLQLQHSVLITAFLYCLLPRLCLQAYISQLKLEGLALTSDMVYVTQSGAAVLHGPAPLWPWLCLWLALSPCLAPLWHEAHQSRCVGC